MRAELSCKCGKWAGVKYEGITCDVCNTSCGEPAPPPWESGYKAGVRDVVEWIKSLEDTPTYSTIEGIDGQPDIRVPEPPSKLVLRKELQAKLKDWG